MSHVKSYPIQLQLYTEQTETEPELYSEILTIWLHILGENKVKDSTSTSTDGNSKTTDIKEVGNMFA